MSDNMNDCRATIRLAPDGFIPHESIMSCWLVAGHDGKHQCGGLEWVDTLPSAKPPREYPAWARDNLVAAAQIMEALDGYGVSPETWRNNRNYGLDRVANAAKALRQRHDALRGRA